MPLYYKLEPFVPLALGFQNFSYIVEKQYEPAQLTSMPWPHAQLIPILCTFIFLQAHVRCMRDSIQH